MEVLLVCENDVLAEGLLHRLESTPDDLTCRRLKGPDLADAAAGSERAILLVAPHDWSELAGWLAVVPKPLAARPWLVTADWHVIGLFLTELEPHTCTLAGPNPTPEELHSHLRDLACGDARYPPASLLRRYNRNAPPLPDGSEAPDLTPREFTIGCGLSLDLANPQVASVLHIAKGTVEKDIYNLRRKLRLADREAVASRFKQTLPG